MKAIKPELVHGRARHARWAVSSRALEPHSLQSGHLAHHRVPDSLDVSASEQSLGMALGAILERLPNFDHIVGTFDPPIPTIGAAYKALVGQVLASLQGHAGNVELCLDTAQTTTPLYLQASALVDYSYASRFSTDGIFEEADHATNAICVVIRLRSDEHPLVLATVRLSWDSDFDLFELFTAPAFAKHAIDRTMLGSVGRFAMHPLFDALLASRQSIGNALSNQLNALRARMFKLMLTRAMQILNSKGVDSVYFISHAALNRWFSRCGILSEQVEEAIIVDSPEVRRLRALYPLYWENEPAVFRLHGMRD